MADEDGAPAPAPAGFEVARRAHDLLGARQEPEDERPESLITVLVAFTANLLIAVAKSAAAAVTGSASMLAEAAH
jgi:divalent metal cation (Fe/Co/Zn/Cd) transporter